MTHNIEMIDNYFNSQCLKCFYADDEYQDPDPDAFSIIFCERRRINMMRFPLEGCEHFIPEFHSKTTNHTVKETFAVYTSVDLTESPNAIISEIAITIPIKIGFETYDDAKSFIDEHNLINCEPGAHYP